MTPDPSLERTAPGKPRQPVKTAISTRVLPADGVPVLRQLLGIFGEAFEDPHSYTKRQPSDAYLAKLLASDTFVAVASFADGNVVGGLAGYVLPKFEQARSEFYIYDLAVAEPFRRRGVATELIKTMKLEATKRGIHVLFVQADCGDAPAVALYTKLGTREDVMHFDIPPSDGAA